MTDISLRPTIRFHGTRGSVPIDGPEFSKYGGRTTCFEFTTSDDSHLLIDFGTGILAAGWAQTERSARVSVLLTHLHWDHILGVPFAPFMFDPGAEIDMYTGDLGFDLKESLGEVMRPPYFPLRFDDAASTRRYHVLGSSPLSLGGWDITFSKLHHPGGAMGYRLERGGRSVAVVTDVEPGDTGSDEDMRKLAAGADVLVVDAQYDIDELATTRAGWGHGSWESAAILATDAGADRLYLTSHDPWRSDAQIDRFVELARSIFPNTQAASEGLEVVI